jgi:hypothetical protein
MSELPHPPPAACMRPTRAHAISATVTDAGWFGTPPTPRQHPFICHPHCCVLISPPSVHLFFSLRLVVLLLNFYLSVVLGLQSSWWCRGHLVRRAVRCGRRRVASTPAKHTVSDSFFPPSSGLPPPAHKFPPARRQTRPGRGSTAGTSPPTRARPPITLLDGRDRPGTPPAAGPPPRSRVRVGARATWKRIEKCANFPPAPMPSAVRISQRTPRTFPGIPG